MIHIVGLYKCGSSWLLQALAAHPQLIAWREFDVLRAVYAPDRSPGALPRRLLDHLRPRPLSAAWMARQEAATLRTRDAIYREMFLGRGWIPFMGEVRQAAAADLSAKSAEQTLDELQRLGNFALRPDSSPCLAPAALDRTLGYRSFRRGDLVALMERVRTTTDARAIPSHFYAALQGQVQPGTPIVCKAADQLMHLQALRGASPGSRLLAIVRDGRDAAISARHYEALMRRREAPWRVRRAGTLRRILGWSLRAAKLAEHARRGEVTVVRYEDLHRDFAGTCTALFHHLDIDAAPRTVAAVQQATDFKRVTAGRERGESADHVVRRGITGEWREAFSPFEARLAWTLAGSALEAFGYGRQGDLRASPLVLGPAAGGNEPASPRASMAGTSP